MNVDHSFISLWAAAAAIPATLESRLARYILDTCVEAIAHCRLLQPFRSAPYLLAREADHTVSNDCSGAAFVAHLSNRDRRFLLNRRVIININ